jgi:hypothetical protein
MCKSIKCVIIIRKTTKYITGETITNYNPKQNIRNRGRDRRVPDRMVFGFITIYAISAYHH